MKRRFRFISALLSLSLILPMAGVGAVAAGGDAAPVTLAYEDFGNEALNSHMTLNTSVIQDGMLKLAPLAATTRDTAYFNHKIMMGEDRSFSTFFTFRLDAGQNKSDGFIFTMNNNRTTFPDSQGPMGLPAFIPGENGFSIEFDTHYNPEHGDVSDNHISYTLGNPGGFYTFSQLDLNGAGVSLIDGKEKYAWVDYDGAADLLVITVSDSNSREAGVALEVPGAGIKNILTIPETYAGFSTWTFGANRQMDIHSWYFANTYAPIDTAANVYATAPTNVYIATDNHGASAEVTVTVKNYDGSPSVGQDVALTATKGSLSSSVARTNADGVAAATLTGDELTGVSVQAVVQGGANAYAQIIPAGAVPLPFAYNDFSGSGLNSLLKLTNSVVSENRLKLSPGGGGNFSAYFGSKITLGKDYSFSTHFQFDMNPPDAGGDGFIFTLNNVRPGIAPSFSSMGISTSENSFSVEFDVYPNPESFDNITGSDGNTFTSKNHIALMRGNTGGIYRAGILDLDSSNIFLGDGTDKYAWIDYDGSTDTMYITVSNENNREAGAALTVENAGMREVFTSRDVYAGFSTIKYGSNREYSLHNWYFHNEYAPIDTNAHVYVTAPTSVKVTADPTTQVMTTSQLTVEVKDYSGNPAVNAKVSLSADGGVVEPGEVITDATGTAAATFRRTDSSAAMVKVKAVAEGGAFGEVVLDCPVLNREEKTIGFAYDTFAGALRNGRDSFVLTEDSQNQFGSAFLKEKVTLGANKAFSTFFTFKMPHKNTAGDGLAFVVSSSNNQFVKDALGYKGMPNSVAVEFDTYSNSEVGDVSANHMGIDINGDIHSAAAKDLTDADILLADGELKYAWVDYDGAGTLTVCVSDRNWKQAGQTLSCAVNLDGVLTSGEVYLGFTAATGGFSARQEITSWYFSTDGAAIDTRTYLYSGSLELGGAPFHVYRDPMDVLSMMEAKTWNSTAVPGGSLPYRLYLPDNYDSAREYPILLFMHGYGERGSDNNVQVVNINGIIKRALDVESQKGNPCIVLAPQCANEGETRWVNTAFDRGSYSLDDTPQSDMEKMVMELLDSVASIYSVDSNRMYISGVSMGGYATWDIIMRYPGLFAAAMPVCGAGDPTKAEVIKNIPIWAFHGDQDGSVPVSGSRDMYAALTAVGGNVKYTEYPGVNHDSWNNAYAEAELLNWMFSQTKAVKGDLSGDGVVTAEDVRLLKGLILNGQYDALADLNGDGNLNILDAVLMKRGIAGQ